MSFVAVSQARDTGPIGGCVDLLMYYVSIPIATLYEELQLLDFVHILLPFFADMNP